MKRAVFSERSELRAISDNNDRNRFAKKSPTETVHWRRTLLIAILTCMFVFSGCLSVDPSVRPAANDSVVFEEFTVDESWASNHVWVNTTLTSTPAASNVTTVSIIRENGQVFSTHQVTSGQTNVLLTLPTNRNATLVASNTANSTIIEKTNVSVTGTNPFPW